MASICSVTFIELSSAPICDPTFPEAINAVTNGANARTIAIEINAGNQDAAPNSSNDGLDCFVKTNPTITPVKLIPRKDFQPSS
jgi:hypothetical protein